MSQDTRNYGDPDVNVSVSAARLLWLAMREVVVSGQPNDFEPEYFCGFSHACMLTLVISDAEWRSVQHVVGEKRAQEFHRQQTAAFQGAKASQRQDL